MIESSEEVVRYLHENPQFFEDYAGLLADVFIPHPQGGRAISLAERQQIAQREKIRLLELKLRQLIQYGEENDVIGRKVHEITLAILEADSFEGRLETIKTHLMQDFDLPDIELRLWPPAKGYENRPEFVSLDPSLRDWMEQVKFPQCGVIIPEALRLLFDRGEKLTSFAIMSLGSPAFGLLVLGSLDSTRFYSEMGTLYLERLAEIIGAALVNDIPVAIQLGGEGETSG
ncbi:MAG: DUF484 family protein [Pseudomonadota bacterium]|nr:DUF484 family protein [Pseudomonadota bacterium]